MAQVPEQIGPYKILAPLGAGGMGRVYKARDERLNRDVALKLLPEEFSANPNRKQRFEQEAKAVAALNHPGIVSLFDVGDGWMVTELVDGESLRSGGPFSVKQVIDIGAQLADALAAAHEAGIAHRDLKPENILLTRDGRTKILDFGLAKALNSTDNAEADNISTITNPGSPLGTPGYMSPEQVRGQYTDQRSDIFSLGVILYEMLAAKRPFEAESAIEVMHAIVHQEPPPLPDSVPDGLRAIVARCLEKKPALRFQSARDLAFALRSLSGSPTAAAATRVPAMPRRSRLLSALAIFSTTVAALTALYFWTATPPGNPLDNYSFRPFAVTTAQEHSGVWSPDGKSIAYIEQDDDGSRLMVQSLDATGPTELVNQVAAEPAQLTWSADGTRIYFLRGFNQVDVVSRAGGMPEQVISNASAFHVSRDGQHMAIWRRAQPNGGHYSVWISSPPGAKPVEYSPAPFAVNTPFTPIFLRFSPNNKYIYLSLVTDNGSETWLLPYPAGTGQPHRIFAAKPWGRPVAASWMPDSRHIVMAGNTAPEVNEQLWLGDVETETLTRILALPQDAQVTPSVSPDGKRILFSQVRRDRDIYRFPLDGSAPVPFLASSLPEFGATWSPDGDQFAFITERRGTDELWVRSPEGNWDRPVVTVDQFPKLQTLVSPTYSPDGSRIAYTAVLAGGQRRRSLAISSNGGGEPTIIADGYAPTWKPDGTMIAFLWLKSDGSLPVATLRVGSDDMPHEIASGGFGAPEWSPDGKWIAVPGFRGVELVSPDASQPNRVLPGLNGAALLWSKDSKTIYGLTYQARTPTLSSMDVATGMVRKIAEYDLDFQPLLDNNYTGSVRLSMSPDGKSFVTTVATNQSNLWILDGFGPSTK
jgi:serine/threonine protein kinase/Tol biopolymer transport system component